MKHLKYIDGFIFENVWLIRIGYINEFLTTSCGNEHILVADELFSKRANFVQ